MELLKKIAKSTLIGSIVGIIVAVLTAKFVPDLIDSWEFQSYDMRNQWKYLWREQDASQMEDNGICIIDIDDRSMHKLGNYWNWNRSFHAEMINTISKQYPAVIAFDIMFFDPEDENQKGKIKKLIDHSKEIFLKL